jgi:branched-chain amino acid transport system ATP-binding protein
MTQFPCLVLENLSREFGGLRAVDRVNLTIRPGERHAVIGPNGAGKTTLFNVISGQLRPTSGRITFFGSDVTGLAPYERAARGIARTFQITRLFLNLTVLENVLLACEALDRRKFTMHRPLAAHADLVQKAVDLLNDFDLSGRRDDLARNLAYGDQRKLEVALSMAGRPRLLLLDEPMAGLSPLERRSMQDLLKKLDPSVAVLLIEHDMDTAFGFADTVTVLYQGRVLTAGHKEEVRTNRSVQEIYLGMGPPDCRAQRQ